MLNVEYDCRWTNSIDEKYIRDYIKVQDEVFGNGYSIELFRKKYFENIYGPSIIVIAYINNNPIASRALWRNDICGQTAYQMGDVCVLEKYRGNGIFSEMTRMAMTMLDDSVLLYSFPNHNSLTPHIKLNHKIVARYFPRLFSHKSYHREHEGLLDGDYVKWWLRDSKRVKYMRCNAEYYLVIRHTLPFCYMILAEVSKDVALRYEKSILGIFFFRSTKAPFYSRFKRPMVVVSNRTISYIPSWKVDSLGY